MNPRVIEPPAEEPVSVGEAKEHLRIEHDAEDGYIDSLIMAAREYCETRQGRAYVTQKLAYTLDAFPCDDGPIALPRAPLISVDSVKYIATDGTETEMDAARWTYDAATTPPRLTLAYGYRWPSARTESGAVRVEFTAGYGYAADVPQRIKHAILLLVGHWHAHREVQPIGGRSVPGAIDFAVDELLALDQIVTF